MTIEQYNHKDILWVFQVLIFLSWTADGFCFRCVACVHQNRHPRFTVMWCSRCCSSWARKANNPIVGKGWLNFGPLWGTPFAGLFFALLLYRVLVKKLMLFVVATFRKYDFPENAFTFSFGVLYFFLASFC